MKQRSLHDLEAVAVEKALATARPFTDIENKQTEALLALVAREAARNLTSSLYHEGYLSTSQRATAPTPPKPTDDLTGPLLDAAISMLGRLALETISAPKKPSPSKKQ